MSITEVNFLSKGSTGAEADEICFETTKILRNTKPPSSNISKSELGYRDSVG